VRPGDPESLGVLMAALDESVAEAKQARDRHRAASAISDAIVETAEAKLAELDPGHEWDVAAGHPHDDQANAYVIRGARLGDGAQPFCTILPGGSVGDMHPELWGHLGILAAQAFVAYAADHDDGGRAKRERAEKFGVLARLAGWSAHHAH